MLNLPETETIVPVAEGVGITIAVGCVLPEADRNAAPCVPELLDAVILTEAIC